MGTQPQTIPPQNPGIAVQKNLDDVVNELVMRPN